MPLPKASDWGGSRLTLAQTCKRKYFYGHLYNGKGLETQHVNTNIMFGVLVHLGLQYYYSQMIGAEAFDSEKSAVAGIKSVLELLDEVLADGESQKQLLKEEVIACLDQYFQKYPSTSDDLVPIEVEKCEAITWPGMLLGNEHTVKLDLFAKWQGHEMVVDHKTTSLGWDLFFKQFKDDLSLKGYAYVKRKQTGKKVDVLINGIRRKKNKALECEFQRDVISYTEKDMEEFEKTVIHIRKEIALCENENFYPKSGKQCVQVYGECEFRKLCTFDADDSMVKTFYREKEKGV